jgi:hypothetical protein
MNDTGKDKKYLDLTVDLTRFQTLLWQSLRAAAGEAPMDQMTPEQLDDQIRQTWTQLLPRLEKNSIVKSKMEKEYNEAVRISAEFRKLGPKDREKKALEPEASKRMIEGRQRAAAFSDLVALFRSL